MPGFAMTFDQIRVLMYGWELPPNNTGGLGVACYGLAKGLTATGTQISFGMPQQLPQNVPFMEILNHGIHNMSVMAFNSALTPYAPLYPHNQLLTPSDYRSLGLVNGPSMYEESLKFADIASTWGRTQNHHLIHAHDWMTFPAAVKTKRISGKPFVAHIHATEYDRTGGNVDGRIAHVEYQGLQAADKVITVSEYTKNIVHDRYAVPKDKISVVYNGVDSVDFDAGDIRRIFPHDHIVLFVGRLTFQKGVDYFLRAAQEVLQKHPNTVFIVVGTGDMYQKLIMDAAHLGISQRVIFAGFLKGMKLRTLYKMADVFVMPSVSEPYGIVALEAIAAGTPVIISKHSGVAETITHALPVDFWDTQKMARLISLTLSYPAYSRELALHAKDELKHLTWDHAAQKVQAIYQDVLTNH
jgi:glycogen synthase